MSHAHDTLTALVHDVGGGGVALVALVATALFASGFALVAAPRLRTRRGLLFALVPAFGLTGSAAAILGTIVSVARRAHLEWVIAGAPVEWTCPCRHVVLPLLLERYALWLLAPLLVFAVPAALGALARARRSLLIGASAVAAAVAGSLAARAIQLHQSALDAWRGSYPSLRMDLGASADVIDAAPWILAVVACLALGLVLARRAEAPTAPSPSSLCAALVVFALGAAAFVYTRSHAADRRQPVSLASSRGLFHDELPRARTKLDPSRCGERTYAPVLDARRPSELRLDHRSMATLDELARDLDTLRRNWSVLHPYGPFPGELHVLADPERPLSEIEPALATAAHAGYPHVRLLVAVEELRHTHTLGAVAVERLCAIELPR